MIQLKMTTSKPAMAWLGYIQKIIATILAIAFSVFYLRPAVMYSTGLGENLATILLVIMVLVFELILHVGLSSFVEGLNKKEFRFIDFLGAVLCFVIVFYISWHSTADIRFVKKEMQKAGLINLDSIYKVQKNSIENLKLEFSQKNKILDNANLPALEKMQGQTWAYLTALKSYESVKENLQKQEIKALEFLEKQNEFTLQKSEEKNKEIKKEVNNQVESQNFRASWLGIVVLIFSIFSTITVGAYVPNTKQKEEELQSTNADTTNNTTNNFQIVVQNQVQVQPTKVEEIVAEEVQPQEQETENVLAEKEKIEIVNTPTILLPQNTKHSQKRILATDFMGSEEYENLANLTEEKKFDILKDMFEISWGTFSAIKRELRQKQIS